MSTLNRLIHCLTVAVLALSLLVPEAGAVPHRMRPGPAPIAIKRGVSVVPRQPSLVWSVQSVFWSEDDGRWFRTERRSQAWRRVEASAVPRSLRRLIAADWRRAEHACAKQESRRMSSPLEAPVIDVSRVLRDQKREDEVRAAQTRGKPERDRTAQRAQGQGVDQSR